MKTQRIYIDTSVVGGYFDDEFAAATQALFARLAAGEVVFVVSDMLDEELTDAPQRVRELLDRYNKPNSLEFVEQTDEVEALANRYIAEKVVGEASVDDCRHIALATVNRVDAIASWNFKHIVNLDRIRGYNGVNLKNGYSSVEIRSPQELLNYGNDDKTGKRI
ncbi:hypothetical protein FACS1894139_02430 [Planctomycetales bacterium]|nr:hypothetical protein FACS1894107_15530 [Planctomycetales bacterium]GHT01228.1 hypothetical protein FACS1894108_14710 [Planctomycetales bacterium]GHT03046.1 hypothetical protein FACS1894139_02430 [Planctomycetales bacterium]